MAYSNFTLPQVQKEFALVVEEKDDLFAGIDEVEVGPALGALLEEYVPLAAGLSTEKARSELIVAPILLELRRRMGRTIGFFSGIMFDVDLSLGLNGYCDYLLTRSPALLILTAPILAVVEAKNENILAGLGQCAAEMVAARIFNEREGERITTIFGVVTTGTNWRFLRLEGRVISLDLHEYPIDQIAKILGILLHCVGGSPR